MKSHLKMQMAYKVTLFNPDGSVESTWETGKFGSALTGARLDLQAMPIGARACISGPNVETLYIVNAKQDE